MKALDYYKARVGEEVWMVCRHGHLWPAKLPYPEDLAENIPWLSADYTRCRLCQVLAQASGGKHVGLTKVHPDFGGVITGALKLNDGTIEHHKPDQVTKAYRESYVKDWHAALCLVALITPREPKRRRARR